MIDVIVFSSPPFMPRTKVCLESVKEHIPDSTIHLVEAKASIQGDYVEGLAKDRLVYARELLKKGAKNVMVLGADCVFYDNPRQFLHNGGDVVLTPHVTTLPVNNGRQLYQTGHVNADLILFRRFSTNILDWLINQDMKNDIQNGIFYEQTWLSALPFIGDYVGICTDVGTNYAYFNFHERKLTKKKDVYYVNDSKLNMVQYSGYVPGQPDKISKHYGEVCNDPLVLELFRNYESRIK